jgi:hypothetical protein
MPPVSLERGVTQLAEYKIAHQRTLEYIKHFGIV